MPVKSMGRTYVPADSYVGPGDILAGAKAFYGVRGYNNAYAAPGTNPALTLVDQAGGNSQVFNILPSGSIDVVGIAAWVAAHSVTTIQISKLWDQSSNNWHFDTTGTGIWPVLVLGTLSVNGRPVITGQTSGHITQTPNLTFSGTAFFSMVVNRTAGTSTQQRLYNVNGNTIVGWDSSPNKFGEVGAAALFTVSDSAPHALQLSLNAFVPAAIRNNGATATSGVPGSLDRSPFTSSMFGDLNGFAALQPQGYCPELGIWNANPDSTAQNQLEAAQRAWYGF
jgi:hypothetical protein